MKIYVLLGKSSTGKDTLYKKLLEDVRVNFKTVITYTTRPIRDNEKDGVEYFFKTKEEYEEIPKENIIEERCYKTVYGNWYYFMMKDNQIDITSNDNYLLIGTLPTYEALKKNYGKENVIPLYIEVDDETRLTRAMKREKLQKEPKYEELCRRFLADAKDFSDNKLKRAGIKKRYDNFNIEECIEDIFNDIPEQNNMTEMVKRIINDFYHVDNKDKIITFFKTLQVGFYLDDDYLISNLPCSNSHIFTCVFALERFGFLETCYRYKKTGKIINVKNYNNKNIIEHVTSKDLSSLINELSGKTQEKNWEQIWQVVKK